MLVVAIIGYGFHRAAKSREMNAILWTILGIGSYFLGQIIAGFIIGFTNPQMANDEGSLIVVGIVSGLVAVVVTFLIMVSVHGNKNRLKDKIRNDESLIDDSIEKTDLSGSHNNEQDEI